MIPRLVLFIASSVLLFPRLAPAQDIVSPVAPARDPRATEVADATLKALAPQSVLSDISLQGTLSYTAGSDYQSGTFAFEAIGNSKSRVLLNLDGGQRWEIRNGPTGYSVTPDGPQRLMAAHNCFIDAPWYFPALSLQALSTDPQVSILYGGQESRDSILLNHLRLYRTIPGQTIGMTGLIQRLSVIDLYLDAKTGLPLILGFSTHPENDLTLDIPVEIQFSDYRFVNGVRVPFRIQRSLQGSLLMDIAVSGATINAGLSDSLFAVPIDE